MITVRTALILTLGVHTASVAGALAIWTGMALFMVAASSCSAFTGAVVFFNKIIT